MNKKIKINAREIFLFLIVSFSSFSVFSQSFTLPSDGKWYLIATIGGRHAYIDYVYDHTTAHNPSIAKGEIQFINAKTYIIQRHQTMGYGSHNQPQFAVINKGGTSELWIKSTVGTNAGTFQVINSKYATLNLGATSDLDLSDNGGYLKIYDKLPNYSHLYTGNLNVLDGNIGIGTTNSGSWKLAVNGKIRAKEIKVETGWSDFVFYDDYKLPTLQEVENHIKEKGHLKDIPSAEEVEENGIFLGEMDSKLLQKIEELTLYTIQQEKEIQKLKKQEREISELKILVEELLKSKK
ncbi:hypothetical protein [Flavivirga eckloniae]|nr:hypothetical protein [Flavivirga eckloniae]